MFLIWQLVNFKRYLNLQYENNDYILQKVMFLIPFDQNQFPIWCNFQVDFECLQKN